MTPKDKAKELVDKIGNIQLYIDLEPRNIEGKIKYFDEYLVKECALIAVDEIIKEIDDKFLERYDAVDRYFYYKEVKKEIDKL